MLPKIFLPKISKSPLKRLGDKSDGGYIVNEKIIKCSNNLITFGLGDNFSFEKHFHSLKPKSKVYVFDHTINYLYWVKHFFYWFFHNLRFRNFNKRFLTFLEYYHFFKKKNIHHFKLKIVSTKNVSKNKISLKQILSVHNLNPKNSILKIDIEEDEYNILDEICRHKFRCIIIEFSELKKNFYKVQRFIRKLELLGIYIIHIHANNFDKNDEYDWPIHLEVTFASEIEIKKSKKNNLQYPIKNLDFPNNPLKKDIVLKFK